MKNLLILLALVLTFTACSDPLKEQKEQFEKLKAQAMESHDVIMPKMDELMQLSSQLSSTMDSTNTDVIMSKKTALNKAHDDMMVWMRDYSEKFPYGYQLHNDEKEAKEKLSLMQEEYKEIEELKERTLKVIEESKALLGQ